MQGIGSSPLYIQTRFQQTRFQAKPRGENPAALNDALVQAPHPPAASATRPTRFFPKAFLAALLTALPITLPNTLGSHPVSALMAAETLPEDKGTKPNFPESVREAFKADLLGMMMTSEDPATAQRAVSGILSLTQSSHQKPLLLQAATLQNPDVQDTLANIAPQLLNDSLKRALLEAIVNQESPHPDQVRPAAQALISLKNPGIQKKYIGDFAAHEKTFPRLVAALSLPALQDTSLRNELIGKLCQDEDPRVGVYASWALSLMTDDTQKLELLPPKLIQPHLHTTRYAREALLSLQDDTLRDTVIMETLESKNPHIRYLGATLTRKIHDPALRTQAITELLSDTSAPFEVDGETVSFRQAGVRALAALPDKQALQKLYQEALEDSNPAVRQAAAEIVHHLPELSLRTEALKRLLSDEALEVVEEAAGHIPAIQDDNAISLHTLTVAKREAEAPGVYLDALRSATRGLSGIQSDEYKQPVLEALVTHGDAEVRQHVLDAALTLSTSAARKAFILKHAKAPDIALPKAFVQLINSLEPTEEAWGTINQFARSRSALERQIAAAALGQSTGSSQAILNHCATLLNDANPDVRRLTRQESLPHLEGGKELDAFAKTLMRQLNSDETTSEQYDALAILLPQVEDATLQRQLIHRLFYDAQTTPSAQTRALNLLRQPAHHLQAERLLRDALGSPVAEVRAAVASHLDLIENILNRNQSMRQLCRDEDFTVRLAAAHNMDSVSTSVRSACRDQLLTESDPTSRAALAWAIFQGLE